MSYCGVTFQILSTYVHKIYMFNLSFISLQDMYVLRHERTQTFSVNSCYFDVLVNVIIYSSSVHYLQICIVTNNKIMFLGSC